MIHGMGLLYMVTPTGVPEPFILNSSFWQLANMVCFYRCPPLLLPENVMRQHYTGNGNHAEHSDANQVSLPVIVIITASIIPNPASHNK